MKPKIYTILGQAVEEGVRRGYYRAFKHVEDPSPDAIIESIDSAVMASSAAVGQRVLWRHHRAWRGFH